MRDFPTNPLKIEYLKSSPIVTLGQEVLRRREALGLSRNQLARLINISQHNLLTWETGKAKPNSSSTFILTE